MVLPIIIIARTEWGARPPLNRTDLEIPVSIVMVYCTDSKPCVSLTDCTREVQAIQQRQMRKMRLPDMQYNFVIAGTGRIYEGRGWHRRSTALNKHKHMLDDIILVGFVGRNLEEDQYIKLRKRMMIGLHQLLIKGVEERYITPKLLVYFCCKGAQQSAYDIPDKLKKFIKIPPPYRPKLMF